MQARPMPSCSACLFVTFVHSVETNKISSIFFTIGYHAFLVFPYQMSWQYSDGDPSNGGVECRWIVKNRDSRRTAVYRSMTAAVRTTLRRWTVQFTAHRAPRISESMFIAADMVDHDEEKRTEQSLIVRGNAAVNLKRNLRSTYIVLLKLLTDTKHRAASLRQQGYL